MGAEDLCMHTSMRFFADELLATGVQTLRFDYHGTAFGSVKNDECRIDSMA